MTSTTLLVNPSISQISKTSYFIMPLGLLSIAAYLRENGFPVEILDFNVVKRKSPLGTDQDILSKFSTTIDEIAPKVLGISIMVAGQLKIAYEAIKIAKAKNPQIVTMIGGAHSSQFPREILENCPEIDFVVLGEGELQSAAIVKNYSGKYTFQEFPEGIAFRENGTVKINKRIAFLESIDRLPFPAYDLLEFSDYSHDTKNWHNPNKVDLTNRVPIITSRGCPNACNFCSISQSMGYCYRPMSATRVVDMIQMLYEKNNSRVFAVYDANFTQDHNRIIAICNEITKRNLKIFIDMFTGVPLNITTIEIIDALASIGLLRIGLSIESGDPYIRNKVMGKNFTDEKANEVISAVRRYPEIFLGTGFVMGMPEDTVESLETSIRFMKNLDVDEIDLTIATPFPGTKLFEQCVSENLFFQEIDKSALWCSDNYSWSNLNNFIIKPYQLAKEQLYHYRDEILALRSCKVQSYRSRMKDVYNIESSYGLQ